MIKDTVGSGGKGGGGGMGKEKDNSSVSFSALPDPYAYPQVGVANRLICAEQGTQHARTH